MGAALLALALASSAHARSEPLRWRQFQADGVAGFRLHLGYASRSYTEVRDLGLPAPDAQGIYHYPLELADEATLFVALTAYGENGRQSAYSNERLLAVPLGAPGAPAPSATGQGAFDPLRGEFVVASGAVHLTWAVAPGAVESYAVYVARDRQTFPASPEQWLRFAGVSLFASPGTTLRVRVAARGIDGRMGPVSAESVPVHFADPLRDPDADGLTSDRDNCPVVANASQSDRDADGVGNACDSCPDDWNPSQQDLDLDGLGDVCDADADGDGDAGNRDLCARIASPRSVDFDGDGLGDACDPCTLYRWSLPARNPPDQNPLGGKVIVSNVHKVEKTRLKATGQFGPAAGADTIDPLRHGVFLQLEDRRGDLLRLNVPPGSPGQQACDKRDGWRSVRGRRGRHTWTYLNDSGSLDWPTCTAGSAHGLRRLVVVRRTDQGPFEYQVEVSPLELPSRVSRAFLRLTLTLGALPEPLTPAAAPASRAGQCAVDFYLGPDRNGPASSPRCRFSDDRKSGALKKIRCKAPKRKKR